MYQYLKSIRYYQTSISHPFGQSHVQDPVSKMLCTTNYLYLGFSIINITPYRLLRYSDHVTCILQEKLIKVRRRYTCTSF